MRGRNPPTSTSNATWALQNARFETHIGIFISAPAAPRNPFRMHSFYFFEHACNCLQVLFAYVARLDQMDEQRFRGTVEDAIDEFPDHAADHLALRMRRTVNEGTVLAAFFQVAFCFENFHHGHHGGVCDFAVLQKRLVDIADGGVLALPDQLHNFEFLGRKCRMLWSHDVCSIVLSNSY